MKSYPPTSFAAAQPEQLIEVLDFAGRALAVLPLDEVRRQMLCHRSVAILLFDEAGRLLLCRREREGSAGPARWDTAARGPVLAGESLLDAASRTLSEQLGLHAERFRLLQELPPRPENNNEIESLFSLTRPEGQTLLANEDEAAAYFYSPEELTCLLRDFRNLVSLRFMLLAEAQALGGLRPKHP